MDTLAAAYAETGDFDSTIKWSEKALTYPDLTPEEVAAQEKKCLAAYQAHKAYRQED